MLRIADAGPLVTGGVDTHAEVRVAGVAGQAGRVLGTGEFPATTGGYHAALAWMRGYGDLVKVGVEGTGSYGAGWPATSPARTWRWPRGSGRTGRPPPGP